MKLQTEVPRMVIFYKLIRNLYTTSANGHSKRYSIVMNYRFSRERLHKIFSKVLYENVLSSFISSIFLGSFSTLFFVNWIRYKENQCSVGILGTSKLVTFSTSVYTAVIPKNINSSISYFNCQFQALIHSSYSFRSPDIQRLENIRIYIDGKIRNVSRFFLIFWDQWLENSIK